VQRDFLPTHAYYWVSGDDIIIQIYYPLEVDPDASLIEANWEQTGITGNKNPFWATTTSNLIYLIFLGASVINGVTISQVAEDPNAKSKTGYLCTPYDNLVVTTAPRGIDSNIKPPR